MRVHRFEPWRVATDADKARGRSFRAFIEDRLAMLDARLANINGSSSEKDSA